MTSCFPITGQAKATLVGVYSRCLHRKQHQIGMELFVINSSDTRGHRCNLVDSTVHKLQCIEDSIGLVEMNYAVHNSTLYSTQLNKELRTQVSDNSKSAS